MKVSLKNKKNKKAVNNAANKKKYKQSNNKNVDINKSNDIITKILISIVIAIIAIVFVFISGVFDVSEIVVEKNKNISDDQIISFSGIEKGTNIFAISKKDIKNKLKLNSYINDVKITRLLPNKLCLIIDERSTEFVLQLADSYLYIDKQGYILQISNEKPDVPIILGFTTDLSNIRENDRLDENDLKKMNIVIKIMQTAEANDMKNLITRIDISNSDNYIIYLDTEGKIAYLGNGVELNTKFLYIKAILKEQQGKFGEIFVNMDLNSEYVYFKENI